MRRSVLLGTGSALPRRTLGNAELAGMVDTSDEWITERTGIRNRHVAAPDETTSSLGTAAARAALEAAGIDAKSIDLIIVATATPDQTFPASATIVQNDLGCNGGIAFDVAAVCSGFLYALGVADSMLVSGAANRALVIGSETFSRILDWEDRTTCVLFGDGAGAVVLSAESQPGWRSDRGVLSAHLRSDGNYQEMLYVDGGPSATGTVGHLRMEGREVFKYAVGMVSGVIDEAFAATGFTAADIDWFVPHQANIRIIDATARKLGIPIEKMIRTVDRHGNTSAASIPLALWEASRDGRIKKGDLLLLESLGGGFTWGAVLLRW